MEDFNNTLTRFLPLSRSVRTATLLASIGAAFTGTATAATINPGELIITEVMANPAAVSDTNGEWFEIANLTNHAINLNGLTIRDDGSNAHTLSAATSLVINPGAVFVLGRDGNGASNGGYAADYVYSSFTLGNSSDAIVLELDGAEIFRLSYSGNTAFGAAGNSVQLGLIDNNVNEFSYFLTPASHVFGNGDIGTPGSHTLELAEVPLPGAAWLFMSALGGTMATRRRR